MTKFARNPKSENRTKATPIVWSLELLSNFVIRHSNFASGFVLLLLFRLSAAHAQSDLSPLAKRPWIEARTTHFAMFSCAPTQQVARVGARLEQFREAYSSLAGAQSVAS